jgi:hypothetical protein
LNAGNYVSGDSILCNAIDHLTPIWITTRDIQDIHPSEDDQEATKEGEGVNSIHGVEATIKDERGAES